MNDEGLYKGSVNIHYLEHKLANQSYSGIFQISGIRRVQAKMYVPTCTGAMDGFRVLKAGVLCIVTEKNSDRAWNPG